MGGCLSNYDYENLDESETVNKATDLEDGSCMNKTEASKLEFASRWKGDICAICSRPVSALPINMDVPRLCKKILVCDGDDVVFDGSHRNFQSQPTNKIVKSLLESVAKFLNDEVTIAALADFDTIVDTTGDIGIQISKWFASVITLAGGDSNCPPSLLVLKTIHQRCIFPAFYCVRELLQDSIGNFKDKRGTWNVKINLAADEISVIHTKRQEAIEIVGEGPKFEFDWNLTLKLTNEFVVDNCGLAISLTDLVCSSTLEKEVVDKITSTFTKNQLIS